MKDKFSIIRTPTRCHKCPIKDLALYNAFSENYIKEAESKRTKQFRLNSRTILYEENDAPTEAYTLFEGWVLLYRANLDGGRQGLRIALPGDFIGYSPVIDMPRNHSVISLTPSVLCAFAQKDLHEMMSHHSALSMQVTQIQAKDMAHCQTNILGIGKKTAESRIAHLILELYDRLKEKGQIPVGAEEMPFPLTQTVLGDLTGLSQVHVNRVMSRLKKDALIVCEAKTLKILNWEQLAELGEYFE